MHLDNLEYTILSDGLAMADGGGMFGVVPRLLWQRIMAPDELNRVPIALNSLLIVTEGTRILVDTGYGDKMATKARRIAGLERSHSIIERLSSMGYSPGHIDIVINTHLHADHAGGNTTYSSGELAPAFPNAEYWVQEREWFDANHPNERTRATYLPENLQPLADRGLLRLLRGDAGVAPGVRCVSTPGHTPGHQSVVLGEGAVIFLGEVAAFSIHLERLAWVPAYDLEPMLSIETKRRIVYYSLGNDSLLLFQHDPQVTVGRLIRDGSMVKVQPVITDPGEP
jgi:glyoxylase-like metal-dependent hydrolase (beta-lactamase superfamily II)